MERNKARRDRARWSGAAERYEVGRKRSAQYRQCILIKDSISVFLNIENSITIKRCTKTIPFCIDTNFALIYMKIVFATSFRV